MKPFNIFLSHRNEDAALAKRLADKLRIVGFEYLNFFLSVDYIDVGKGWRRRTREIFEDTELFLLLLTAPSDLSNEWDWSLFEVGLFSTYTDPKKTIIALSPPNFKVPAGLADIRNFQGDQDGVSSFLKMLFADPNLTGDKKPIRPDLFDVSNRNFLNELVGEICALLSPPSLLTGARMHANSIIIKLKDRLYEPMIPKNVEIDVNIMSLKMFGLLDRNQFTWGDILGSLIGETTWVSELSEAIYAISNGRYATPIKSTFPSVDGQSFIPVVYRDEARSSGLRLFHVLFVPTDIVPVDPKLVFVISAYRDDMEPIYEAVVAAANTQGLTAKRVKDILGDYRITDKILSLISQAKYVIADLTHERPNVYFELGYARGLGKTVITTVRKNTNVHFDVKDWTYIEYDDSRTLERMILQRLKAEVEAE